MELEESKFMYNLGAKIKEIRINKGMTIEVLSSMSELSVEKITQIESGEQSLPITDFITIMKALDEDPDTFLRSFDSL